jgi:hypothetical protein
MSIAELAPESSDPIELTYNRTGVASAFQSAVAQQEAAVLLPVTNMGVGSPLAQVRRLYEIDAEPLGSMPMPNRVFRSARLIEVNGDEQDDGEEDLAASDDEELEDEADGLVTGEAGAIENGALTVLLDKLSERCSFERTGTRLYEGIVAKLDTRGTFEGGPTREELVEIMRDEHSHFQLMTTTIASLGGDPTLMSPCADVSAIASCGLSQIVSDPRTTLGDALHAALLAELADNDGWDTLIELASQLDLVGLKPTLLAAKESEDEHLEKVRLWLAAYNQSRLEEAEAGLDCLAAEE